MSVQRVSISTSCLNEVGGALCQVCTVSVFRSEGSQDSALSVPLSLRLIVEIMTHINLRHPN